MNRSLALAISMATLFACERTSTRAQPAPASVPSPKPVEPGGVAPAPGPPMTIACTELHIAVAKDKVSHSRDTTVEVPDVGGAIDPVALAATLGGRAAKCIGPVLVTAADDVTYQDLVTVLDVAGGSGFIDVGFGEESMHNEPAAPIGKDALAKAPVVIVSKTEVTIGDRTIALAAADLQPQVQAALAAAKRPGPSGGIVVLQADAATTGKTLNAIVRGGNQAGFGNLLFAVQHK